VSGDGLSVPRGGGQREQLRLLLLERRGAVRARTAALNQLSALVVTARDPLRHQLASLSKRLAATSPIDASSTRQRRHRLNRGGDRQLNWALHVIALQRIHHHARTAASYHKLLAAGKTAQEARRRVKRALARHLYHHLQHHPTLPSTT
jgi:transposase